MFEDEIAMLKLRSKKTGLRADVRVFVICCEGRNVGARTSRFLTRVLIVEQISEIIALIDFPRKFIEFSPLLLILSTDSEPAHVKYAVRGLYSTLLGFMLWLFVCR